MIFTLGIGIAGILLNTIIGNSYDLGKLGVFNQVLSTFIFTGLISIAGVKNATLKFVSENKKQQIGAVLSSSVLITLITSVCFSIIVHLIIKSCPDILFSFDTTQAFHRLLLAIPFFSINKVFLSYFNGIRKMKTFSFYGFLRVFLSTTGVLFAAMLKYDFQIIIIIFIISEIIISILLIIHIYIINKLIFRVRKTWVIRILKFAIKSFFLEIIGTSNVYIDIFFISIFLTATEVGKYSLAISVFRGLLVLSSSVQQNFNPIISNLWSQEKQNELERLIVKVKIKSKHFTILLFCLAGLLFPLYINLFFKITNNTEVLIVFYTLLLGFIIPSVYGFSSSMLTMANFLNTYIKIALVSLLINTISSYFLINTFDLFGAAIATSLFHNIIFFLVFYEVKKKMNILLFNKDCLFKVSS